MYAHCALAPLLTLQKLQPSLYRAGSILSNPAASERVTGSTNPWEVEPSKSSIAWAGRVPACGGLSYYRLTAPSRYSVHSTWANPPHFPPCVRLNAPPAFGHAGHVGAQPAGLRAAQVSQNHWPRGTFSIP